MSTQLVKTKELFNDPRTKAKFEEMLGKRSATFMTSVIQIVSLNSLLSNADSHSIVNAALTAATLDLPINNNLGFAYIIPYSVKQSDGSFKQMAQFQLGYKAFIQLAQRSGQFKTISAAPVHEGQIISEDPLNGYEFDWKNKTSDKVVGYAAYFKLINGFEKTLYMTVDELKAHGVKYSKTAKKENGLWNTDFDAMAQKTVIKLLLSKFAPLSVEMQTAAITDQSVINNADTLDVTYVDNDEIRQVTAEEKESERLMSLILNADSREKLERIEKNIKPEHKAIFKSKMAELV